MNCNIYTQQKCKWNVYLRCERCYASRDLIRAPRSVPCSCTVDYRRGNPGIQPWVPVCLTGFSRATRLTRTIHEPSERTTLVRARRRSSVTTNRTYVMFRQVLASLEGDASSVCAVIKDKGKGGRDLEQN